LRGRKREGEREGGREGGVEGSGDLNDFCEGDLCVEEGVREGLDDFLCERRRGGWGGEDGREGGRERGGRIRGGEEGGLEGERGYIDRWTSSSSVKKQASVDIICCYCLVFFSFPLILASLSKPPPSACLSEKTERGGTQGNGRRNGKIECPGAGQPRTLSTHPLHPCHPLHKLLTTVYTMLNEDQEVVVVLACMLVRPARDSLLLE
jgi:hypothetical protein